MKKGLLYTKKGAFDAKMGVDLGLSAIFVLAIGLTIVVEVINNITLTGIASTVAGYAPLIVVAVFIYGVARMGGVI